MINIEGNLIDEKQIDFVNVEYLNDTEMKISVHFGDEIYICFSRNQELVDKLDKLTDLCSVK